MSNITQSLGQNLSYSPKQLQLIKRTVARDTTDDEFNMFVEICKRQNLDPFRRQIHAVVFNKDKPDKRQVAFVTGIDGYRSIAKRTGTFRNSDKEPDFDIDESRKSAWNPEGIIKASICVYQFGVDKEWYPIIGTAHWDEFAPMIKDTKSGHYEWVNNRPVLLEGKEDVFKLTKDTWLRSPFLMIAKCAEAQAIRKGWPEEAAGFYVPEEMDFMQAQDVAASEAVEVYEANEREKAINVHDATPMVFDPQTAQLVFINNGKLCDKVLGHIKALKTAEEIERFKDMNKEGLRQFWAKNKSDALDLSEAIEKEISNKKKDAAKDAEIVTDSTQTADKCEKCGGKGLIEDSEGKSPCPECANLLC